MAVKLYIGGLSYDTNEDGLREAFAEVGEVVSAAVITDRATGRSRGFGFVEMADEAAADAAIAKFDGQELDGRRIHVSVARPMEERSERRPFSPSRGGGDHNDRGPRKW